MEKIKKENSIFYNQLWINQAIIDGHSNFLPDQNPKISIGQYIENKYETLQPKQDTPKITKRESLLFTREWILKAKEEGISIPKIKKGKMSLGEIIELKFFEKQVMSIDKEEILFLPGESYARKKVRK